MRGNRPAPGLVSHPARPYHNGEVMGQSVTVPLQKVGIPMSALGRLPLLGWILIAIVAGVLLGQVLPEDVSRVFFTFNDVFGSFISFLVPLIILGFVTPAIADLGAGAGKWLAVTVGFAYGSTIFSGLVTLAVGSLVLPRLLSGSEGGTEVENPSDFLLSGYLELAIPPVMDVMTALVLAFMVGIVLASRPEGVLQRGFVEFRGIVQATVAKVLIPLLPLHIFGLFLNLTHSGQALDVIALFLQVVVVALILHVLLLLAQYGAAGAYVGRNPLRLLTTMLPAYITALGTSSSAATIPVTLRCARNNGISKAIADFVIPLCATIHLSGSTMKITLFSMAVMVMYGLPLDLGALVPFIVVLGIVMIAAPGVPGGAIVTAVGILQSMLGFDDTMIAMMIATYIAIDSFGTATNVTGDGAIALTVDKMAKGRLGPDRLDAQPDARPDDGIAAGERI